MSKKSIKGEIKNIAKQKGKGKNSFVKYDATIQDLDGKGHDVVIQAPEKVKIPKKGTFVILDPGKFGTYVVSKFAKSLKALKKLSNTPVIDTPASKPQAPMGREDYWRGKDAFERERSVKIDARIIKQNKIAEYQKYFELTSQYYLPMVAALTKAKQTEEEINKIIDMAANKAVSLMNGNLQSSEVVVDPLNLDADDPDQA